MNRRDILAGLGCAAALGTAEWLRPTRKLILMPKGAELAQLVPAKIAGWSVGGGGDIVIPKIEGTLAARLYHDQLAREYVDPTGVRPNVMVLIAYGGAQNDFLQLHRPETCYPAIGFEIVDRKFVEIPLPRHTKIPAVALTAKAGSRIEDILYWTRLGDTLPRTQSEQRTDRLRAALAGYVGDGVLVRASTVRQDKGPSLDSLMEFLEALVAALPPTGRIAFLGRQITA